jgi:predicted nucleotidyltransferase component of viral defense system
MAIRLHQENPRLFLEAIRFTAAETGFIPRLIEKDYFCSVVLEEVATLKSPLTFKGGTLLAKVHSGFYRLSDDLDFSISTQQGSTKKSRSQAVAPIKTAVNSLAERLPELCIETALTGSNGSTQYNAIVSYPSALADQRETIKVEIGLREEIMTPIHSGQSRTLLLNPLRRGTALVPEFQIASLSHQETMAEKLRAALCRREVAIRDFFDVDHAVRNGGLDVLDRDLLTLVKRKIEVLGTGPINVSPQRREQLAAQLEAQLRPVLRSAEFEAFNLSRAFEAVAKVAESIR